MSTDQLYRYVVKVLKKLQIPFNDPCDPDYTGDCSVCGGTGFVGTSIITHLGIFCDTRVGADPKIVSIDAVYNSDSTFNTYRVHLPGTVLGFEDVPNLDNYVLKNNTIIQTLPMDPVDPANYGVWITGGIVKYWDGLAIRTLDTDDGNVTDTFGVDIGIDI